MIHCLLMSRGETRARMMLDILQRGGVPAALRRSPLELSGEGCGFAVEVAQPHAEAAMFMLRRAHYAPRKIYCESGFGYSEVCL